MDSKKEKIGYESDLMNINYDFIEYYVGMAKMVVYWHVKALGFKVIAYAGPETGVKDKFSYYLVKNNIKLVITSASQPSSYKIISFVDLHGNGIKRLAIESRNVEESFNSALKGGAIPIHYPEKVNDKYGTMIQASVKLFDDNEITFIDYQNYTGPFLPGYEPLDDSWAIDSYDTGLTEIDHIACVLRINEISLWENYINNIFKSRTVKLFDERQVPGEKKIGMYLKVLQSDNKRVNNVLVEPDDGAKTQVQLFIDENYGAGIQHIAFSTENIFKTVELLRKNGIVFTRPPKKYYKKLKEKYPNLDIEPMEKHGVLCDVIDGSLLLQIFTSPIGDRPTFFYEIIQRVNNYEGFGLDNIRVLFESLELELEEKLVE